MDNGQQAQLDILLPQLQALIHRGNALREQLSHNPSNHQALAANRLWHQEIGVTVYQLSGGSKAHWLARGFSEAFLLRSVNGEVVEGAAPAAIVERLIHVLQQAVRSLSQMDGATPAAQPQAAPAPRRFDFVHNVDLRAVLEQAYQESRDALEQGDYSSSLFTASGILESIVTDALEHRGLPAMESFGVPPGRIVDWPFDARLAVAEQARLIRGGCARLPENARRYRDSVDESTNANIGEQDARRTMQVLNVVMRDLDPGR
jgi:hypothetical protein